MHIMLSRSRFASFWVSVGCLLVCGCASTASFSSGTALVELAEIDASDVPRELDKVTLPEYRVEPPDILLIEAVINIRPPSDKLRAGDQLLIRVANGLPLDPDGDLIANEFKIINNYYPVQTNGTVDLGPEYGSVQVEGLTLPEAQSAIEKHLKDSIQLRIPKVAVSMADVAGKQDISGEHLIRPDGTVSLGVYGSVYVTGMTLDEVKQAVEEFLAEYIHKPEVQVDVLAYNSKVYYVITDGGGFGEQVARIPFTGNETVLDAISEIQGLSEISSKTMWIARPAPAGTNYAQTLMVDWRAITQDGVTSTNYQILPGDRIYIQADHMITFDNWVSKTIAPFERIAGAILFGHGLQRELQFGHIFNQFGNQGGGF